MTAGQAIVQLAASNLLLQAVAEICLWIAFEQLNNLLSPTQPLVIPASDISTSQKASASTPECPDITAAPNCDDCGGDNGNQLCIGTYNAYTSCPCYDPPNLKWAPFDSADLANMGASFDAMTAPLTTTTSSSAAPAATTPVLTCQNYATYYDGSCRWNDVSASDVNFTAWFFPAQYPNNPMTADAGNVTQAYNSKGNPYYLMNVGWIPGCTGPSQVVQNPVASDQSINALDLLKDAYYDCEYPDFFGGIQVSEKRQLTLSRSIVRRE